MSGDDKTLGEELAAARAMLDEESWIDENSLLDEDGEPDDVACRVVRADDVRAALDRIEAAAERERAMLDANIARVRELEDMMGGAADALLGAAIKQKSSGNAAAMREALMKAKLYFDHRGEGTNLDDAGMAIDAITSIDAALSAPARNCDRYPNWETALPAWAMETGEEVDSKTGFRDNAQLKRFLDWLFAPAEGGAA